MGNAQRVLIIFNQDLVENFIINLQNNLDTNELRFSSQQLCAV
jgi:hypothetical protein